MGAEGDVLGADGSLLRCACLEQDGLAEAIWVIICFELCPMGRQR